MIDQYGAEVLRLWVSAADYRDDVRISKEILTHLAEAYRRIRKHVPVLLGTRGRLLAPGHDRVLFVRRDGRVAPRPPSAS